MVLYIRGSLKMVKDMDSVYKYGLMVLDTRACGVTMSHVVEANSSTQMEMFMMVCSISTQIIYQIFNLSSIEFNDFIR